MTAISDDDVFTAAPSGPPNGGAGSSTLMRGYLGEVNNRVRFLYNRLVTPIRGAYRTFAAGDVNTGTDRITITSHGWATNDVLQYGNVGGAAIELSGVALPLAEGFYGAAVYARVVDADTIELAASVGGGALNITAAGSGTHYLWKVPSYLAGPIHRSFVTAAGVTIPAANLIVTLANSFLPVTGGTVTGIVQGDDVGRWIKRTTLALPDSNSTFDVVDADCYYQTTPTAQRDHEIDNGGEEEDEVEVRRGAAGNFAIVLHRSGSAAAICTLPALTCCSARLKKIGGVWTLLSYSGAVVPGADAG